MLQYLFQLAAKAFINIYFLLGLRPSSDVYILFQLTKTELVSTQNTDNIIKLHVKETTGWYLILKILLT